MHGLEWGSGRSTCWFAGRINHLVSVEYDQEWYVQVRKDLDHGRVGNCDLRYIALDHPKHEPTRERYAPLPKYVAIAHEFADESLDFVEVDGHYRVACILEIMAKIKKRGYLLVDDTKRLPIDEWRVPRDWVITHQSENVMSQTTISQKPD